MLHARLCVWLVYQRFILQSLGIDSPLSASLIAHLEVDVWNVAGLNRDREAGRRGANDLIKKVMVRRSDALKLGESDWSCKND